VPSLAILVSAVLVLSCDKHTNTHTHRERERERERETHTDAANRLTHATIVGVNIESVNRAIYACVSQDAFVPPTSSLTGSAGPQKKKRTKVTDTRLSPRVARALLQDGFYHRTRPSLDLNGRKQHPTHLPPTTADLSVVLLAGYIDIDFSKCCRLKNVLL